MISSPLLNEIITGNKQNFNFAYRYTGLFDNHLTHRYNLNYGLSVKDEAELKANLEEVANYYNLTHDHLQLLKQHHGNDVYLATVLPSSYDWPIADSVITTKPNLIIGIQTADCAPIIIIDKIKPMAAVIHCGWRGACNNIIGVTIEKMLEQGAHVSDMVAIIGPTIALKSYEVGGDVIGKLNNVNDKYRHKPYVLRGAQPNKFMLDLPAIITDQLKSYQLKNIEDLAINTYADDRCFSHR
ncbi:MAG: peptidoglycan editing factor PgeF, partial [Pseudomonadota bacterium]